MKLVCRVDRETWESLDSEPLILPVPTIEVRCDDLTQTRRARFIEPLGTPNKTFTGIVVLRAWSDKEETA